MIRAMIISCVGFAGVFLSSVMVSRLLGVEGKGVFSLFMATVSGLWVVAALGVPQGQLYHASRDPKWLSHFMANGVIFAGVLGGIVGLGYFLGGRALGLGAVAPLVGPVLGAGILAVPAGVLLIYQREYFLALHRYELAKASGAVSLTLPVLGYLGLYLTGHVGVTSLVGAYLASQLLCFAVFHAAARGLGPSPDRFSWELARRSLTFGGRQWASDLTVFLAIRLDFFVVVLFLGERGLGLYSVAVALAEIITRLSNEIGTMLWPIFAGGSLKSGQPAAALRVVTLAAVVTAAALGLISEPLVRLLFGPAFVDAVPALRWLLLGTVAWSTINVTYPYISAIGRPGLGMFVFGLAAAVDVLLNLVFLPRWGVSGAGIAATLSYVVAAVIFLRLFRVSEGCTLREALVPRAADCRRLWNAVLQVAAGMARKSVPSTPVPPTS
jgi:O-antigen/teichoic acid export membrane protein